MFVLKAVSCDELLVDLSRLCKELSMDPLMFATRVRSEVETLTNCSCSVGLGSNLLLARLALKLAKPAGQAVLRQEQAEQALEKLEVVELPGVGRNTVARSVFAAFLLKSISRPTQVGCPRGVHSWRIAPNITS